MFREGIRRWQTRLRDTGLAGDVMGNEVMKKVLVEATSAVEQGETLSSVLRKSKWYPPLLINMLATGEKTGKVDELLQHHTDAEVASLLNLRGVQDSLTAARGIDYFENARRVVGEYRDILGPEGFWLEMMDDGLPEQKALNPKLLRLSKETGAGVVAIFSGAGVLAYCRILAASPMTRTRVATINSKA